MVNNEAMWNIFLGGLARTAKTHYSNRRICERCGKPICNSNQGGYCQKCLSRERLLPQLASYTRGTESTKHLKLKEAATIFLKAMGCKDIKSEVSCNGSRLRFDIMGELNNKLIAVECGGSRGLREKAMLVDRLFLLPYGETTPFLWGKGTSACSLCGHRI